MGNIIEHPALREMTKVNVDLGAHAWHGYGREALWAKRRQLGVYELHSIPFFAVGYAFGDFVSVQEDEDWRVTGVVARSGHSTYRVLVDRSKSEVAEALSELSRLGCTYETLEGRGWTLYALDMPQGSARSAYQVLQAGLAAGFWDFDEGLFVDDRSA